jgi:glycosyltransferase involved in cell wall biosynthesis
MGSTKNILIVVNSFGRGGAEMSLAILAKMLIKRGYKVAYIALWEEEKSYDFSWLKMTGVEVVVLKGGRYNILSKVIQLLMLCKKQRPSFVYTAMLKSDFLMSIVCLLFSIPHLVSVRINPAQFYNSRFKRIIFASFLFVKKSIVFISKKAIDEYRLTFFGRLFKSKQIYVLHNPIEFDERINSAFLEKKLTRLRSKFLTKSEAVNIVIVSRMVKGKGVLETLSTIKDTVRNSRFYIKIFGTGPLANEVVDFIKREELSNNVTYMGFNSDRFEIFTQSDILIFPSENEGFGRVPFEAMLHGCLVLCNRNASILNEFSTETDCWQDYNPPLELSNLISKFEELDVSKSVKHMLDLQSLLSPELHVDNFISIMHSCNNENSNERSHRD